VNDVGKEEVNSINEGLISRVEGGVFKMDDTWESDGEDFFHDICLDNKGGITTFYDLIEAKDMCLRSLTAMTQRLTLYSFLSKYKRFKVEKLNFKEEDECIYVFGKRTCSRYGDILDEVIKSDNYIKNSGTIGRTLGAGLPEGAVLKINKGCSIGTTSSIISELMVRLTQLVHRTKLIEVEPNYENFSIIYLNDKAEESMPIVANMHKSYCVC